MSASDKDQLSTSSKPVYGSTNPSPEEQRSSKVRRYASCIELVPDKEEYYRKLHANVWSSVQQRLKDSNVRNYSIYTRTIGDKRLLFSYFEYVGKDFAADMDKMKEDPETRRWWQETDPCQKRLDGCPDGEQWTPLEMVFLMP